MARKGESIYKRKDGRWEARYILNNNGKKVLKSVYAKTYMDVKNKRIAVLRDSNTYKAISSKNNVLLSELMWMWLENNRNLIAISSFQKYEGIIRNHIEPCIGKVRVIQINKSLINEFVNFLLVKGNVKTGRGLTVRSVNSILSVISSALAWSYERFDLPSLKIPFLHESHNNPQVLNKIEQNLLEEYANTHNNVFTAAIMLSLYTGMRLGEICALQWEDITKETLFIHRSMQRIKTDTGHWEIVVSEPKTQHSCRIIPIPERLKEFFEINRRISGYVFLQANGKFIEPRLMQQKLPSIFKSAGITVRSFHSLRHTFATRLIDYGSDPKTVSELLGHATVQITLNKYVHPSFDMKKTAIEKLYSGQTSCFCGQICGQNL